MKHAFALVVAALLLWQGCGGNTDTKLEAFNPEAFAYDLGDGWEINATVRLKGFAQPEVSGNFSYRVSFSADLQLPDGKLLQNMFAKKDDGSGKERFGDIGLEAQFELDSTYAPGKYTVIYNITDENSRQAVTAKKEFELGGEE